MIAGAEERHVRVVVIVLHDRRPRDDGRQADGEVFGDLGGEIDVAEQVIGLRGDADIGAAIGGCDLGMGDHGFEGYLARHAQVPR